MKKLLHHWFLPHHTNNHRARILHYEVIAGFIGIFLYLGFLLPTITHSYPQVLGAAIDISTQQLLLLTNQQRQEAGIGPLTMNAQLTKAAQMKAAFMFKENFWAHNAPDGTTPWDFIKNTGYDYIYAGENLARGFTSASDVIDAWMASPEHRDNMLSANYRDVGFAVAEGNLTGEKDTTLVVEMFGNTTAIPVTNSTPQNPPAVKSVFNSTSGLATHLFGTTVQKQPLINSLALTKNIAVIFLIFFIVILVLDIIITKKKHIIRIFEHNIDHVLFLGFILLMIGVLGRGVIY